MRILNLGIRELIVRWRAVLAMGLTLSIPVMLFFLLNAYQTGLDGRYERIYKNYLVAQVTGSMGEFFGSRMLASMEDQVKQKGINWVAKEIHTVTGTSPEKAILLRGVELDKYSEIEDFQIIEGRPLQSGDAPRLAMVGIELAEQRQAFSGDVIEIRGRNFLVTGVFANGTYADYEAWVSLEDAQTLLGWGSDISVLIFPANQRLKAGDSLPGGISIVQKGESGQEMVNEWKPVFQLLKIVTTTLGLAVSIALTNVLWRLAWLRRRELAILQSIGFGKFALMWYLFSQGLGIAALGYCMGLIEALFIGNLIPLQTAGISIKAVFDLNVVLISMGFAGLITLAGAGLPALWFSRFNLVQLMKAEG